MTKRFYFVIATLAALLFTSTVLRAEAGPRASKAGPHTTFQTSDRCLACHNGMRTASGADFSIGIDWRSSIMANSSRDPYWQASVRRETMDHAESRAELEDECSVCHMPITRYQAKLNGNKGEIFSHFPFNPDNKGNAEAEDGISCSVCHQIGKENLGTHESFSGNFVVDPPLAVDNHPEYGPFAIEAGRQRIMDSSSGGFKPSEGAHIRDSALCGTCHTLYTTARGKDGKQIGVLPEQMPYLEWLHSDYPSKNSCQSCHMPEVEESTPITAVFGVLREGARHHVFVGGNFFMQNMLNRNREELSVSALPDELTNASARTTAFLNSESARVSIDHVSVDNDSIDCRVHVQNLSGHKLPTAYPSRRAWLHIVVKDQNGRTVFESGALNPDGSVQGNDNDSDAARFESHYRKITRSDQVQIYESILQDESGHVTTGLIAAVGYLKDNRLLPSGFRKETANKDIQVIGDAADDPDFNDAGDTVEYLIPLQGAIGPFHVNIELWYQPIGFRWAHNLASYDAAEPRRFVGYYDSMSSGTAVVLAHAEATR